MGLLFLVRHATTAASAAGRNLGQRSDAGLTEDGLRLAERLACAIARELLPLPRPALRLVTSPARRCQDTAASIARALDGASAGVVARVEAGLRELDYGSWDGLTPDECRRRDPELRAAWEADPYTVRAPSGESGADVAARSFPVLTAAEDWARHNDGRVVIVVSHNHVIRIRLAALLGLPLRDYRRRFAVDPGSYSLLMLGTDRLTEGGGATVRRLGALAQDGEC
jgi:broad specificity phosphatase PhoE